MPKQRVLQQRYQDMLRREFLSEGRGHRLESCRVRQSFQLVTGSVSRQWFVVCPDNSGCRGLLCFYAQIRMCLEIGQLGIGGNGVQI